MYTFMLLCLSSFPDLLVLQIKFYEVTVPANSKLRPGLLSVSTSLQRLNLKGLRTMRIDVATSPGTIKPFTSLGITPSLVSHVTPHNSEIWVFFTFQNPQAAAVSGEANRKPTTRQISREGLQIVKT